MKESVFLSEFSETIQTGLVNKPVEMLTAEEQPLVFLLLGEIEDLIKARKAVLRLCLLDAAKKGEQTEKGGYKTTIAGINISHEYRKPNNPNENSLKELLESNEIAFSEVFDKKAVEVLNPSKLRLLIERGRLEEAAITKLIDADTSSVLRITPNKEVKSMLNNGTRTT